MTEGVLEVDRYPFLRQGLTKFINSGASTFSDWNSIKCVLLFMF